MYDRTESMIDIRIMVSFREVLFGRGHFWGLEMS